VEILESENIVRLHLVDGQRGDSDLTENGSIVDPGGPVVEVTAEIPTEPELPQPTDKKSDSGGGSGGSCFIQSLF
jgi:hypothetical protein